MPNPDWRPTGRFQAIDQHGRRRTVYVQQQGYDVEAEEAPPASRYPGQKRLLLADGTVLATMPDGRLAVPHSSVVLTPHQKDITQL